VLRATYSAAQSTASYSPGAAQAGQRALKLSALSFLVRGATGGAELAARQYREAANMTDRFGALAVAVASWTPEAEALLADFRKRYAGDPLVFDKWLGLSASPAQGETIERVRAILAEPDFPKNNPNRLRALLGNFTANPTQFARADGAGFRFVTEFVADVDKRNPQVAARVLTGFRTFRNYEPKRRAEAESALKALRESGALSRNTADILGRTLDG
ncbi:MAG: aminopeptidase N C-terminal domain-containing protein, partial [Devosia sp.]